MTPDFRNVCKTLRWLRGKGLNQQGGRHNGSEGGLLFTHSFSSHMDTMVRLTVQLKKAADTNEADLTLTGRGGPAKSTIMWKGSAGEKVK